MACEAFITEVHSVCAGLDDTLFVGEGGSDAALAQEELHAALREVRIDLIALATSGQVCLCPCSASCMHCQAECICKCSAGDAGCKQKAQELHLSFGNAALRQYDCLERGGVWLCRLLRPLSPCTRSETWAGLPPLGKLVHQPCKVPSQDEHDVSDSARGARAGSRDQQAAVAGAEAGRGVPPGCA